ncbi:MAG: Gfo/Idh/MocA family oxidoreductase [Saccharofermentanales bacterium]|jgi:predicted dehydrogenase
MKTINIGLVGHKFMGRAHTHAITDAPIFFDPGLNIVKKTICSNEESVFDVAKRWGWEKAALDWRELIEDDDIDAISIAAPSKVHAEIAIAAAQAGKHVFCEKPLALDMKDAEAMVEAVNKAGVVNMVGFNFRRVPALCLAKQLIEDGTLGEIYHFRAIWQQDWLTDPMFPMSWRLRRNMAGYGTHGDLGAHLVDIARFLVGEIDEVCCTQKTFVKVRPKAVFEDGLYAEAGEEMGEVDVDDASQMLATFQGKDIMAYFESTRNGTGHRNQNLIEVSGSKGAVIWEEEKLNELEYYNVEDPAHLQGFRRIVIGEPSHPYMSNWWPVGHIIGYGDTFVNEYVDYLTAIKENKQVTPNFEDGLRCQRVLDAAEQSAHIRQWVKVQY